ncbi:MAG: sigma-70 family RNA polymerase sigma factor [Nanoarchaeota archaeon]|nr:sigma-70 family RNA polymerase sigma factor [Nanoarchaeota archaeon]
MSEDYSGPIGIYLRDVNAQYQKISRTNILNLLRVVRMGTFPRDPLVIEKADFLRVNRKDKGYIEIEAPKLPLINLKGLLRDSKGNYLLKRCSRYKRKLFIELVKGAEVDFENTNYLKTNLRTLLLRLRTPKAVKAREKIIYSSLPFVIRQAKRFCMFQYLDDLVGSGNVGLVKAIDKFSPKREASFFTCAGYWVDQSIRIFIQENRNAFKVNHKAYAKESFIKYIEQALRLKSMSYPTDEEILEEAKKLKKQGKSPIIHGRISLKDIQALRGLSSANLISLSEGSDIRHPYFETPSLADKGLVEEDAFRLLDKLAPRSSRILRKKFGLLECSGTFDREIALEEGCCRETVKNLKNEALEELAMMMGGR